MNGSTRSGSCMRSTGRAPLHREPSWSGGGRRSCSSPWCTTGAEPVCRVEWIVAALDEIMALAGELQIDSLALPLPGVRHGRIPVADATALLLSALAHAPASLRRIWLFAPPEEHATVRNCWPAEEKRTDE